MRENANLQSLNIHKHKSCRLLSRKNFLSTVAVNSYHLPTIRFIVAIQTQLMTRSLSTAKILIEMNIL